MTFDEFYTRVYLERHADRCCRLLHLLGLGASLLFIGGVIWWRVWWLLLLAPLPAYLLSWLGHIVAHNRPTVYARPVWSFRAYWRMIAEIARRPLSVRQQDSLPSVPAVPSRQPG
jgi:hypothetical protein